MRCPLVKNTLEGSSRNFYHQVDAYLYSPSFPHGSKLHSDLGGKRLAKQQNSAVKKGNVRLLCCETRAPAEDNGHVGAAMALIYAKKPYTMR